MTLEIKFKLLPHISVCDWTRKGELPDYHLVGWVILNGELTGERIHALYSLPHHYFNFPRTRFMHGEITPRKKASWENMALRKCLEQMSKRYGVPVDWSK